MFGIKTKSRFALPFLSRGRRIYAIGDVHGSVRLLSDLLHRIQRDHSSRVTARAEIVFLGDLIDRGDDPAYLLRSLHHHPLGRRCRVLRGNHEAILCDVLAGDHDATELWLRHGGATTLLSFGVPEAAIDPDDTVRMIAVTREVVPPPIRDWLAKLPLFARADDYFLVHAGVRPGVPLGRQRAADLLWIREPFLSSEADHGAVIVHGHTMTQNGVEFRPNRIGIDTGAYATGRLSALALEGEDQWVIQT